MLFKLKITNYEILSVSVVYENLSEPAVLTKKQREELDSLEYPIIEADEENMYYVRASSLSDAMQKIMSHFFN